MHTIVALSTPVGSGAINIVRMSGPSALLISSKIFSTSALKSFLEAKPRYAYLGKISLSSFSDECICLFFKGPHSYTGEDLIEFQCHGSIRLAEEIINECIKYGAVPANKGEFTKRAFINGKLSLSDAEGIIDMINSESLAELKAASRIVDGSFSSLVKDAQEELLNFVAEFETSLDYPDEYDGVLDTIFPKIKAVYNKLLNILNNSKNAEKIKSGINVAIVGNPNAGKSSLLNYILGENKAIVTNIPGTTRDVVEGVFEYKGFKINFFDTAGIRNSDDEIEKIGIEKSLETIDFADIIIYLKDILDATDDTAILNKIQNKKYISVLNKIDLDNKNNKEYDVNISVKTGENISLLLDKIINFSKLNKIDTSGIVLTSIRQKTALKSAVDYLNSFILNYNSAPTECVLLDLKNCYFELGKITGSVANEDVISLIFEKFCVGK